MTSAILICTLGAAPQVVTLLLDGLLAHGEPIERVVVLHTDPAYAPIKHSLPQLDQTFRTDNYYRGRVLYDPHVLTGKQGILPDVATRSQIDAAYVAIYRVLRQHKTANRRLHVGIAGGRKTLTVLALAAAQATFTDGDQVWHLISPQKVLKSGVLHVDEPKDIQLVSVPLLHTGHMMAADQSRADYFMRERLTDAEREVCRLLLNEGLSNAMLAQRLGKSASTIANQLTGIYRKAASYYQLQQPPDRAMLLALLGRSS